MLSHEESFRLNSAKNDFGKRPSCIWHFQNAITTAKAIQNDSIAPEFRHFWPLALGRSGGVRPIPLASSDNQRRGRASRRRDRRVSGVHLDLDSVRIRILCVSSDALSTARMTWCVRQSGRSHIVAADMRISESNVPMRILPRRIFCTRTFAAGFGCLCLSVPAARSRMVERPGYKIPVRSPARFATLNSKQPNLFASPHGTVESAEATP